MGQSSEYAGVPQWEKEKQYKEADLVRYEGRIFVRGWEGAGDFSSPVDAVQGKPGSVPWAFYDHLYDQSSQPSSQQLNVIGYIPAWLQSEGFDYSNATIYQNITHGIVAFLEFDRNNPGAFAADAFKDVSAIIGEVVAAGHAAGARIMIALGGAGDYGFKSLMTDIAQSANDAGALQRLDSAARQVVEFVTANGLDGVDLDLECWWDENGDPSKDEGERDAGDPHPAGVGLTAFAKKLRELLPEKTISAAVFGTSYYGNNYDEKIVEHVDWLSIMTYDFTGSWRESPVGPHTALKKIHTVAGMSPNQRDHLAEQHGPWPRPRSRLGAGSPSQNESERIRNNPVFSVEDSVAFWTNPMFSNYKGRGKGLPIGKICIGVATYGYDFAYKKDPDKKTGQVAPGYRTMPYKDILALDPAANAKEPPQLHIAGSTPTPDFVAEKDSDVYPYEHNIFYETPSTAVAKANFARTIGAKGIIVWEVHNDVWEDGRSIIKALYQYSGNESKPRVDTASPVLEQVGMQNTEAVPLAEQDWLAEYDKQWNQIELRRDMKVYVTESVKGPATIARSESTTVGFSVGLDVVGDVLEKVKATLKFTYTQSYTHTTTYSFTVDRDRSARVIYIPNMHHFNGWITTFEGKPALAPGAVGLRETRGEKVLDHVWCPLFFPVPGGKYELEYE